MGCCSKKINIPTVQKKIIQAVKQGPLATKSNRVRRGSYIMECPNCNTKTVGKICPICEIKLV